MNEFCINKLCCLIITYNPDEGLLELVKIINKQVNKIIIVDNNSDEDGVEIIAKIEENYKLHLIKNSQNLGIAKALNQGVSEAKKMKYDWVITFDQDTLPFNNIINIAIEVYNLYPFKNKIGAIGVNYSFLNEDGYNKIPIGQKYMEKDYLITSGCLISINTFFQIGGFREDFFIDNVDLEFSLRLIKHKKISLIAKKSGMCHKAGDPQIKKFCGLLLKSSNHNSFRRYYMARNHVLLSKEYFFEFPYFILKLNYFFFLSLIKILLIEKEKKSKLTRSMKGLKDGIFYSSNKKKYNEQSFND